MEKAEKCDEKSPAFKVSLFLESISQSRSQSEKRTLKSRVFLLEHKISRSDQNVVGQK